MGQRRQGFQSFCVNCEDTVTGLLQGSSSSIDLEKKVMDNVSAGMSNILDKFEHEISKNIEALKYRIDFTTTTSGSYFTTGDFCQYSRVLEESKKGPGKCL